MSVGAKFQINATAQTDSALDPAQAAAAPGEHDQRPACSRQRQLDPACRLYVTQRDDLEPVAELGIAAASGVSQKSGALSPVEKHCPGRRLGFFDHTGCTPMSLTLAPRTCSAVITASMVGEPWIAARCR